VGLLFDRRIELWVYQAATVEVFREYDMSIDVELVSTSDPNNAAVEIWGLSEAQRSTFPSAKYVEIYAGYADDPGMIFRGSWDPERSIARHYKDGPDWRTEIETGDGLREVHSAFLSRTYSAGTALHMVLRDLVGKLGLPVLMEFARPETLPAAATFSGRVSTILDELAWMYKFDWSIQYGSVIITERGEPSRSVGTVAVLSSSTGLVGSPVVTETGIELKTMMLPGIKPKGLIQVKDDTLATRIAQLAQVIKKPKTPIRASSTGIYVVDSVNYIGDNRSGDFGCLVKANYA
jgi:hypothetical protein